MGDDGGVEELPVKAGVPFLQLGQKRLIRLILLGDELTLERLPMRLTCVRTEQV